MPRDACHAKFVLAIQGMFDAGYRPEVILREVDRLLCVMQGELVRKQRERFVCGVREEPPEDEWDEDWPDNPP